MKKILIILMIALTGCAASLSEEKNKPRFIVRSELPGPILTKEDLRKHSCVGIAALSDPMIYNTRGIALALTQFAGIPLTLHDISIDAELSMHQNQMNLFPLANAGHIKESYPEMRYLFLLLETNPSVDHDQETDSIEKSCDGETTSLDIDQYHTRYSSTVEVMLLDLQEKALLAKSRNIMTEEAVFAETEDCPEKKQHIVLKVLSVLLKPSRSKFPLIRSLDITTLNRHVQLFLESL